MNFLRPGEELRLLAVEKPALDDLVIRLPLRTGLSPGEMADMVVDDVCYEYNLLFVWRSKVSRDHPVIVDSDTMWRIYRYLDKRRDGSLLELEGSRRMRVQAMRRIVKQWAGAAGLARWHRVTPYTLRHTFCIKWILGGGTIEGLRRQLGHQSLQKLKHYLDFDYSEVKVQYARIFGDGLRPDLVLTPVKPEIPYAR